MNKLLVMTSALLLAAATATPAVSFAGDNDKGKSKSAQNNQGVNGHGVNDSKHGGKHVDRRSDKKGGRDKRDDHHDHATDFNDRNDRQDRHDNRYYAKKRFRNSARYIAPRDYRPARYIVGNSLPPGYYDNNYYVNHNSYSLAPPPRGYQWVRVDNDVYLVSTGNGQIRDILYSLFY